MFVAPNQVAPAPPWYRRMRRTILIVLAASGGLVFLLLVGIAIALWRIDPNDFVGPIQARITQVTGRAVTINGGIDLHVSLTPRLVVHDLAFANAAWGRAPLMVAVKQLDFEVALLPLLHQRLEVIRVGLTDPSIALETDGQGHANWDFGRTAAGATPAASAAGLFEEFGIENITVTNGTLSYHDGKSWRRIERHDRLTQFVRARRAIARESRVSRQDRRSARSADRPTGTVRILDSAPLAVPVRSRRRDSRE